MGNRYTPWKNAEGYADPTPYEAEKNIRAQLAGRRSKLEGETFERLISASCDYYRDRGLAKIEKTPEPMKPLGAKNKKGQFLACYTKQAQPDYGGTLKGGRSIYFEAKHTDDDRIEQRRLTKEQSDDLEDHHRLGAVAFVLVSFGLCDFYRVPWPVWRDMAKEYGRKYIKQTELEPYEVPATAGYIKFLDGKTPEVITIKAGAADTEKLREAMKAPGTIVTADNSGDPEKPRPIATYEGNGRKAVVAGDGGPPAVLFSTSFYEAGELVDVRYYQGNEGARRAARKFIKEGGAT